jgi:hypothetical protein
MSVLFAFVFFRWRYAIVYCIGMKHYREEVEEKQAEAPTRRSECRQQHKNPDWDRTKHPEKARKLVALINMSQAGDDTKDNGDGVTRFAFRSFTCATRPIAAITLCGIFREQMPAVWTRHFVSDAWLRPNRWCIRVLHTHFNH